MPGHIGPEVLDAPLRHFLELLVRVVLAWNQQGGDLEPDVGLVLEISQRVQHRLQMTTTNLVVEILREPLQIDISGIHVVEELLTGSLRNVAGCDRHGLDVVLATSLGHVDRILQENDRVVVGVGHTAASQAVCRLGDLLR